MCSLYYSLQCNSILSKYYINKINYYKSSEYFNKNITTTKLTLYSLVDKGLVKTEGTIKNKKYFNKSYRDYTYFYPILTFRNCDDDFTSYAFSVSPVVGDNSDLVFSEIGLSYYVHEY